MHKQEPLLASQSTQPRLIQLAKLHANLDMYTEPSGHPRAQSTNMHADINAARYTLLHLSSAETGLFSEHPVLHSSPCAFRPLLGHPGPPSRHQNKTKHFRAKCPNYRCLKRVSPLLEPFSRPAVTLPPPHPPLPLPGLAGTQGRHVRNVLQ